MARTTRMRRKRTPARPGQSLACAGLKGGPYGALPHSSGLVGLETYAPTGRNLYPCCSNNSRNAITSTLRALSARTIKRFL
jgi:hypothetical protein